MAEAAAQNTRAQDEEQNRLLYVALTRAEDELIVCGAEAKRAAPDTSWYESVKAGFARLGGVAETASGLVYACAQTATPDRVAARREAAAVATLPRLGRAAPDWSALPPRGRDHAAGTHRPQPRYR